MIRAYHESDRTRVESVYRQAFAGPPWHEQLTEEEVSGRWQKCIECNDFKCLVQESRGIITGFTCWDYPTIDALRAHCTEELVRFVRLNPDMKIIWIRETCVDPKFQGRGIAHALKRAAMRIMSKDFAIILTRLRTDNPGIIKLNEGFGLQSTNISVPSRQHPGAVHEYWYSFVGTANKKGSTYSTYKCDHCGRKNRIRHAKTIRYI